MGYEAKCDICGRKYWQDSSGFAKFTGAANVAKDWEGTIFGDAAKLVRAGAKAASGKKNICPECMRAQAFAGGTVIETNSEAKKDPIREQKAKHKSALNEIKDYVFDESSDSAFFRSAAKFANDYTECAGGFFQDREYKKFYIKRFETELKLLKETNYERYEKLNEVFEEAKKDMKKKLKIRFIISSVIFGTCLIGLLLLFIIENDVEMIPLGIFTGFIFGLILGAIPQCSFGNTKTQNE